MGGVPTPKNNRVGRFLIISHSFAFNLLTLSDWNIRCYEKNSHDRKQHNELKALHASQLHAYQKAAKQALTNFAESVDIPILLDEENEITYFQRIYELLDIPAWAVDQSVLDECIGAVLQKRISEVLQDRASTEKKSSDLEKKSIELEKDVDSEKIITSPNDEKDESNQIALVLAGLSQNAHEYKPPAAIPKLVAQESNSSAPVSPKAVAQENNAPDPVPTKAVTQESKSSVPVSPKAVAKESKNPTPASPKAVTQENKSPTPASKTVKKTTANKGVSTRGRTSNTKTAPKKGTATTAKVMQTRATRGRKANRGRGRGGGASGGKNSKKNATKWDFNICLVKHS